MGPFYPITLWIYVKGFLTSSTLTGTYLIDDTANSDLDAFLVPKQYYYWLSIKQALLDLTVFIGPLKWS